MILKNEGWVLTRNWVLTWEITVYDQTVHL